MLEANDYIDDYLKWLKDNSFGERISHNTMEITAPYLDRHNDFMQIYIIEENDGYTLTDDGFIISDLEQSGLTFNTPKRNQELKLILNRFGVKMSSTNALTVKCQKQDYPKKSMLCFKPCFLQMIYSYCLKQVLPHSSSKMSVSFCLMNRSVFHRILTLSAEALSTIISTLSSH